MTATAMSDTAATVAARWVAATLAGTLTAALWWSAPTAVASAASITPPAVETTVVPSLAASAPSPCEQLGASLATATAAVERDVLTAVDDMATIAAALIEQCGWNVNDTTTGGRTR